ncbi:3-oxo-5alpha-steroid 4-dehydrogenase [Nitrospirillum amazonense]|uniref:3-oxo-5alpha-steroid 4-dehydrogenase n=1 Tax=Nitrospirillum amazonense TaxID=28077 RepID=A0A560F9Z8_9PROT|nr:FAD-binding protein [Nitrospirillum amazonense]TWB18414.1 3-oxo-5alpha-steroid 4-dehydrogenase [Nitrospirillum amazonense]TWB66065.1 3-oxo-5alpha-steroid 4-dehydrogenase [Nitrospirillum amazonense]
MTGEERPGSPGWHSAVEAPLTVADASEVRWDAEADLVVVGYGGAGVAAAVEAAERGASVIAVDRYHGGGATAMNGGVLYAGGGTSVQQEAGVEDTVEDMYRYLRRETEGVVSDRTLHRFCAESPEMVEWLKAHGVAFNSRVYWEKTSYPHSDYYLYHSDSCLAPEHAAVAKPAPRGHRVFMPAANTAVGYGVGLYYPLQAAAAGLGVRLWTKAECRQLVVDRHGHVLGVRVLHIPPRTMDAIEYERLAAKGTKYMLMFPPSFPGAGFANWRASRLWERARAIERTGRVECFIHARKGVCLSTGGFIFNRPMVAHHAPAYVQGMPLGSPGDDGSGIRLGQTVGGAVARMNHVSAWRFINPPLAWAHGVIVDRRGERYVNEMLYGAAIGQKMCEERGGRAYLILDQQLYDQAWQQVTRGKVLPFQKYPAMLAMRFGRRKARTLAALAERCGFDPATLDRTVTRYNQAARGIVSDAFNKGADNMAVLERGPFYALDMSIDAKLAPLPTLTLGGLTVDEDTGAVLNSQGRAIPGLYAAGRAAVGICSNLYVSGLSAADCIFSGRRVGAVMGQVVAEQTGT